MRYTISKPLINDTSYMFQLTLWDQGANVLKKKHYKFIDKSKIVKNKKYPFSFLYNTFLEELPIEEIGFDDIRIINYNIINKRNDSNILDNNIFNFKETVKDFILERKDNTSITFIFFHYTIKYVALFDKVINNIDYINNYILFNFILKPTKKQINELYQNIEFFMKWLLKGIINELKIKDIKTELLFNNSDYNYIKKNIQKNMLAKDFFINKIMPSFLFLLSTKIFNKYIKEKIKDDDKNYYLKVFNFLYNSDYIEKLKEAKNEYLKNKKKYDDFYDRIIQKDIDIDKLFFSIFHISFL